MRRLPLLMLVLSATLFLSSKAASEPLRIAENLRHETVLLPLSTPKSSQLDLVDYAMVVDEDNGLGVVFMYDDA